MKALLLLAAVALVGCENMPQRGYSSYTPQPYMLQHHPMPIQQAQPAQQQRQPLRCSTRYVGNTAYTDCY